MNTWYDIGDRPRSSYAIELDDSPNDPATVKFLVVNDDGEEESTYGGVDQPYPITRESTGHYFADVPLTRKGRWVLRWVALDGDDLPIDATEREFRVRASAMAEPLGT